MQIREGVFRHARKGEDTMSMEPEVLGYLPDAKPSVKSENLDGIPSGALYQTTGVWTAQA